MGVAPLAQGLGRTGFEGVTGEAARAEEPRQVLERPCEAPDLGPPPIPPPLRFQGAEGGCPEAGKPRHPACFLTCAWGMLRDLAPGAARRTMCVHLRKALKAGGASTRWVGTQSILARMFFNVTKQGTGTWPPVRKGCRRLWFTPELQPG